ncbi:MAG: hypothetical protein KGI79_02600 [Patescibacteria group bacterium]|nr:hypothetical protein [Patescibacteria group bacterium]MDE2116740.1 hypothetical protein [Patescibacteria group bacterium]
MTPTPEHYALAADPDQLLCRYTQLAYSAPQTDGDKDEMQAILARLGLTAAEALEKGEQLFFGNRRPPTAS